MGRPNKKQSLLNKARYHESQARNCYQKLEQIERKEGLIGFKTKNDNRTSSDKFEIKLEPLIEKPYYYE